MARYLEVELAIRHKDVRPSVEARYMVGLGKQLPITDVVCLQKEVAVFIEEQAVEQYENKQCDEAWDSFFFLDFEYVHL